MRLGANSCKSRIASALKDWVARPGRGKEASPGSRNVVWLEANPRACCACAGCSVQEAGPRLTLRLHPRPPPPGKAETGGELIHML